MKTLEYLDKIIENPDNSRRPVQIVHNYFPKTAEDRARYFDCAVKNGLGGFVVNMDVSLARCDGEGDEEFKRRRMDAYLGHDTEETEAVWDALRLFITEAFENGFEVWIYDEKAYPSGAAGSKVIDADPDYAVKGLIAETFVTDGGVGEADSETGDLRFAAAYELDENSVAFTDKKYPVALADGKLKWELPAGKKYRVTAFFTRKINFETENRTQYVDLMRADVVDKFIEVTHEMYRKKLGDECISKITAFFTDEPGLPTHGCSSYFFETNAVAAWTEEMDERMGDGFEEYMVDLFFDTDRDYASVRRKYWKNIADLYSKNYFGRIAAWCEKYGTKMTGHLYGEETLSMQIGLNADLFGLMRYMQMPGVDRLYCVDPRDVTAEKSASSAAHLYGRTQTMTENSFHLEHNWWHTPEAATAENRLNSSYYQIQLGITNISSYFGYSSEYSEERKIFEERAGRASMFACTGKHETDVLVLIPMGAAYERYTPQDHKYWDVGPCTVAPHQPMDIQILEKAYGEVLGVLEDTKFDFDLIDEQGLAECKIDGGKIVTPYEAFKNLVVFDSGKLEEATEDFIVKYVSGGGHVTVVKTDRPNPLFKKLREEAHWAVRYTESVNVANAVADGGALPVLSVDSPFTAHLGVRVKKTVAEGCELYFIHNRTEEDDTMTVFGGGEYVMYSTAGEKREFKADEKFELTIPAKDAVMLVKKIG